MSDAATPAAAPAAPAATPAKPPESETVTLSKAEHEQLSRDAARAASAQSRADRLEKILGRSNGGSTFKEPTPAAKAPEPSEEDRRAQATQEDVKASRGLTSLAVDPTYREILDADPTLRDLLIKNPLAALPLLAPDALDAEDAIELVKAKLDERKSSLKKPASTTEPVKPTPAAAPPAGGVNATTEPVNEAYEAAKKLSNPESAIAGMVKAKLSGLKK